MKCKVCGGAGVIQGQAPGLVSCCPACNGKGFIELTNEEWFCGLSTKEKADKLTDFSFWLVPNLPTEDKREQVRKRIENWLKEKHDEM